MKSPQASIHITAIIATFKRCALFRDLPPDMLSEIAEFTIVKSLAKDEFLFHEGDQSFGCYVVQIGTINVHRVNALGKEQVIHLFRAGESFAEGSLATNTGYPADARAIEQSQVLLIRKDDFVALVCRHPELAMSMLASMSRHLRDLVSQIDDLQLKSVETRLANWLIKRCPDSESTAPYTFILPVVKRVLAQEIGTVSETLSRTLAKLSTRDFLSVDGKQVTIHSPANLAELLREHLGE